MLMYIYDRKYLRSIDEIEHFRLLQNIWAADTTEMLSIMFNVPTAKWCLRFQDDVLRQKYKKW